MRCLTLPPPKTANPLRRPPQAAVADVQGNRLGQGSDLEIGGPGSEPGHLDLLRDLTFDAQNRLYVLEGREKQGDKFGGNCRVQRFDPKGAFQAQFSLLDEKLGDRNDANHLAVDSKGNVYVTRPQAGLLQQFSPDGKLLKSFELPGIAAVAVWTAAGQERVIAMPARNVQNQMQPAGEVLVVDPATGQTSTLKLDHAIVNVHDIDTDPAGNLYVQGGANQVYKFDPAGKLLTTLGGGTTRKTDDGSELVGTVAVDSKGNIYSHTFGNPANVTRLSADLTTVIQAEGQFRWADAWDGPLDTYYAVDREDRLWVGVIGRQAGDQKYHFRPCVLRTAEDFFAKSKPANALGIGLTAAVGVTGGKDAVYAEGPMPLEVVVSPAYRRIQSLTISYKIQAETGEKQQVAQGQLELPLEDNKQGVQPFSFTPPKAGWYAIECQLSSQGQLLKSINGRVGLLVAAPDAGKQAAATIREMTGANTRIAWIRCVTGTGHPFGPGEASQKMWKLMVLDTDEAHERELIADVGAWHHPLITPSGKRVIWSDNDKHVWIINFDGTGRKKLLDANLAVGVAENPAGVEWVYVNEGKNGEGGLSSIVRYAIDDLSRKELVWDKTPSNDKWEFSRDGTRGASGLPWPHAGVADLPNGAFKLYGDGCTPGFSPEAGLLMHMKAQNHPGMFLYNMDGSNQRYVDFRSKAPGLQGVPDPQFWFVAFARYDGRFFTFSGPHPSMGGKPSLGNIYFCQLNDAKDGVAKWVEVTSFPSCETEAYAWIAPRK